MLGLQRGANLDEGNSVTRVWRWTIRYRPPVPPGLDAATVALIATEPDVAQSFDARSLDLADVEAQQGVHDLSLVGNTIRRVVIRELERTPDGGYQKIAGGRKWTGTFTDGGVVEITGWDSEPYE